MSSSISSSDGIDSGRWRRWIVRFLASVLCAVATGYAATVLCDPYSTGRFSPLNGIDIAISGRALQNYARLRVARFDSAIIGNSHGLYIDPLQMDAFTGRHFVQLGITGIGADVQLAVARAFARERQEMLGSLVWVVDDGWCARDGEFAHDYDHFPFWLYESSTRAYLLHVFSIDAIQGTLYRLGIHFLHWPQFAELNGRWAAPTNAELSAIESKRSAFALHHDPAPATSASYGGRREVPTGEYAFVDRLESALAELDPQTPVVLFFMPYGAAALPQSGSHAEAVLAQCKVRFDDIVRVRPRTSVIDHFVDNPIAHDPRYFSDLTSNHVGVPYFKIAEREIASALGAMR
jgi:hypothetical protein